MLRTAADTSTPRGSALCAYPRGVCCAVCRILAARHSVYASVSAACCRDATASRKGFPGSCDRLLCGLHLVRMAADKESCSGDSESPILRLSFCEGHYIPFVNDLFVRSPHEPHSVNLDFCPIEEPRCALKSTKNKGNSWFGV